MIPRNHTTAMTAMTISLVAAVMLCAGGAAHDAGAASRPSCTTLERALRRGAKLCARRALATRDLLQQTTSRRRCEAELIARLRPALLRAGCRTIDDAPEAPLVASTGTFRGLAAGAGSSDIIAPDPSDRSTKVFLHVTPPSQTVVAGESVTYTITVQRVGTPESVIVPARMGAGDAGFGVTQTHLHIGRSMNTVTFTVTAPATMAPGTYAFGMYGLTSENKLTQEAPWQIVVQAAPTPPPVTDTATVVIENSNRSVFAAGTYPLSAAANQVGALFDDENNDVVDVEPAGSPTVVYPRFPAITAGGGWTLQVGRRYAGAARIVLWAVLNGSRFIAVHLNVSGGTVTPALLVAGDLNNPGVVLSTETFELQLTGELPTGGQPGFLRGIVDGVPMFLEPNLSGNLWADRVIFSFDVRLYAD